MAGDVARLVGHDGDLAVLAGHGDMRAVDRADERMAGLDPLSTMHTRTPRPLESPHAHSRVAGWGQRIGSRTPLDSRALQVS